MGLDTPTQVYPVGFAANIATKCVADVADGFIRDATGISCGGSARLRHVSS
jgi:hypothetical protein